MSDGIYLNVRLALFERAESAELTGRTCRTTDLNLRSSAWGTLADAMYLATKVALFRIADSVVHFGRDQCWRIFEMAPSVVETEMTKSMPVHDFRSGGDWASPEQDTELAEALASGTLDAFTGRYVWAVADSEDSMIGEVGDGFATAASRFVLC